MTDITRRTLIRGAAGTAATAYGVALAGCTGGGATSTNGQTQSNTPVQLPTYKDYLAVKPDLPAGKDIPPAVFEYPANPKQLHDKAPANGGTITMLKLVTGSVPPGPSSNPFWQKLNKRMGADLKLDNINAPDYRKKFATTIAGGDIPDMVTVMHNIPNIGPTLQHLFQDLSPWLSGNNASQYPALAAIPTWSWRNVAFLNGLWGIPWPLGVIANDYKMRKDILDKQGVNGAPSSGQEFLDMCKELTRPKDHQWALVSIAAAHNMVMEMVGAPNHWKIENDKFISAGETPEYKKGLDILRQMWSGHYIYPGSLSSTANQKQWFTNGTVCITIGGYTNWNRMSTLGHTASPSFELMGLVPPKWDGGGAARHHEGPGMYIYTALKKAKKARIEELLTVLNWIASPFGSEEYLFTRYGIAGRDYTLKGTDPVETPTGQHEAQGLSLSYIANGRNYLYIPGNARLVKTHHAYLKKLMQDPLADPTVGLYSNSFTTINQTLSTQMASLEQDIILGRKPVSDWDDMVKRWKKAGGDKLAAEYAEAYQKKHGG